MTFFQPWLGSSITANKLILAPKILYWSGSGHKISLLSPENILKMFERWEYDIVFYIKSRFFLRSLTRMYMKYTGKCMNSPDVEIFILSVLAPLKA